MGLFVTNWLFGEEAFKSICYDFWNPHLTMFLIEPNKGILGFSFLTKEGESLLYSIVPEKSSKEFFNRYQFAISYISKELGLEDYIRSLVKDSVPFGEISRTQFEEMNEKFFYEVADYDLLNSVPLYERMTSLIFFGSWELIEHFKFIYYPQGGTQDE